LYPAIGRNNGVQRLSQQVWREFKRALRPAKRKLLGVVPRAQKDYATHIPVLLSLAQAFKVEKVLELGCGKYSTLTFLNSAAFPALVSLESLETDPAWLDRIRMEAGHDSRLHPRFVSGAMSSAIEQIKLDDYNLIFVDDSTSGDERAATISAIAGQQSKRAVVVIHDFEVQAYRVAASAFRQQYILKAFTPQTGVVWNGDRDLTKALRRAGSIIKRYGKKIEPDDVSGWTAVLTPIGLKKDSSIGKHR
jgi:predicted O-methyltransferase YrrM